MTFSEARSYILSTGSYPATKDLTDLSEFERVQLHNLYAVHYQARHDEARRGGDPGWEIVRQLTRIANALESRP